MKKSLFHTIMPSDLLAELIKQPEATRGQWAVQFALDLIGDNTKDADSKYAKEIIMATKKFRERKSASGKKGMQKRYDKKEPENSELANSDITEPNTVITKGKVKVKVKNPKDYSEEFLAFWELYPNKKSKAEAFKAWQKHGCSKLNGQIAVALAWQGKTDDWTKENGKYVPMASTYLNKKRWEDEPTLFTAKTGTDPSRY
jgi:hypothetical protein